MDYRDDNIWLMYGDAIERMKEIPTYSVDMIFADIPYELTANGWDIMIPLDLMWDQVLRIAKPNAAICLMAATPFDKVLGASKIQILKYEWIWHKNKASGHLNAKKMPMRAHENILVFYRDTPTYNSQKTVGHKLANSATSASASSNYGNQKSVKYDISTERHPTTVLQIPVINNDGSGEDRVHPTQKPIPLTDHFVKTYSNEGDTVCDFTMGAGGLIKSAVKLNRKAIGIDNGRCDKPGHKFHGKKWTNVVIKSLGLKKRKKK